MNNSLYVIDGFSLAYRGHFALLRSPIMNSSGVNVSSLIVFANVLLGILEREQPTHIVAVFDESGPTFRHEQYTEYKAGRDAMPEDLAAAVPLIRRLLDALAIPALSLSGWEADDLAATLARRAEAVGWDTYIITSDKDYEQLASPQTRICKPAGRGEQYDVLGEAEVLEKWQIARVDQVIDILALMGDKVDNVPGVPGIGEKTAQKLIGKYGTVESLLSSTDELKGKQKERLEEHAANARLSKALVKLRCDAPLEFAWDDFLVGPPDEVKIRALCTELELHALTKRILGDSANLELRATLRTIHDTPHVYEAVLTQADLTNLASLLKAYRRIAFDLETTGLDVKSCEILGAAFSVGAKTGYYVSFKDVGAEVSLGMIADLVARGDLELVGHNLKFDLGVLRWHNISVGCALFDTMLAAFVCMPEQRRRLNDLAAKLLGYEPISIETLIGPKGEGQRSLQDVAIDDVVQYAAEDADIALQLADVLAEEIDKEGLKGVLQLECRLIPVLVEMEYEGIRLERGLLNELSELLTSEIQGARERVHELAGEAVDLNSPRQLGEVLFDKLKLDPNARRTAKSGQYQTSEAVLRRIESRHEIIGQILHYRMCTKLKSVYVSQLPASIYGRTGRVHTQYDSASIVTGRLQSHDPNLQTIPVRTEMGRRIRAAFVARDSDHLLLAADYSQIELRIAAEFSRDVHMRKTFLEGADIHAATAAKVYDVGLEEVTDEMRQKAKMVNFGIIYGISAFGLAERLNISRVAARTLIDQYFVQFPGIASYIEDTLTFAREHEYVTTLMGRRRYVRNINSRNRTSRQADERNAINSRIQGTGADMIKIAMHKIHDLLIEGQYRTRMLLQVHDELVFDLSKDEVDVVPPLVESAMCTAVPLSVPVRVDIGIGVSWLDAH